MTVMPASGEVADKAVSTEDAASNVEVARLEAVLAALVETKVESMKAAASTTATRRAGSAPASPRRPRLTSSSTASSSQNHYHHHHNNNHHHHHGHHNHHHHHHNNNNNKNDKKRRDDRRHRRHDSAPCGELIDDLVSPHGGHHRSRNGGKGHRRDSEQPIKSPRKKRRHSRSPQGPQILPNLIEGPGPDPGLTLLSIDGDNHHHRHHHHHHHHHLDLLNFERARDAFADSHEFPKLQQSSCCFSQSATQLKIHYDVDDYVALNIEEDLEDEEESRKKSRSPCDRYHRPKRKRKRRRRRIGPEGAPEELVDPEELPPRARWTIVATACLLLAMSLLLVGVTLRMAPIIDDMGDGRRASVSRKGRPRRASTVRRKGSIRPGGNANAAAAGYIDRTDRSVKDVAELPPMNYVEIAQDRSRKKIVMIVLAIFIFLLVASILVVVITLTHSSFHSLPNNGSSSSSSSSLKESTEHQQKEQLRRENEELLNSLSRDSFVPDNVTSTIST